MKSRSDLVVSLLRKIADAVSSMSDDDLNRLVQGKVIVLTASPSTPVVPKKARSTKAEQLTSDDLNQLRTELEAFTTREEGIALLESRCQTREHLQQLQRLFDLPVRKDDNRARLVNSIVEASIGYRLRSRAVQGSDSRK